MIEQLTVVCSDCGKERHIPYRKGIVDRCLSCAIKRTWQTSRKHITPKGNPDLGEIRFGRDIGAKDNKHRYIWAECPLCEKQRWVTFRGQPKGFIIECQPCSAKRRVGSLSPNWKGGIIRHTEGYTLIKLNRDDFFMPMANSHGYVSEHRLVMARSLSRCLLPWEIVHHKNGKRDDNRIENLELLPGRKYHIGDTLTKSLLKTMKARIAYLEELLKSNGISYRQKQLRPEHRLDNA